MESYKKRLIDSVLLNLFATTDILLAATYVNMLFLTHYPASWLVYFYASQGVFIFVSFLVLNPLSEKWPGTFAFMVFLVTSAIILLYLWNSSVTWYALPFLISVFLAAMRSLWGVAMWNVISDAFNLREFKRAVILINVTGAVGTTALMLIIPLFIHQFGASTVPYGIIVLAILSAYFIRKLPSLEEPRSTRPHPSKKNQRQESIYKVPLFILVAAALFISLTLKNLLDYALKLALSENYSDAQIGSYSAIIFALGNALTILLSLFTVKRSIAYFGVPVVSVLTPLLTAISVILAIIYPSLITIALVFVVNNAFSYSYDTLGPKLILNALPHHLMNSARMLIRAYAVPLSFFALAALIGLGGAYIGLQWVSIMIFVVASLGLILSLQLFKHYSKTLEKSIHLKIFHPNYFEKIDQHIPELNKINAISLPSLVASLENSNSANQFMMVKLLCSMNTPDSWKVIKDILARKNPLLNYYIVHCLAYHPCNNPRQQDPTSIAREQIEVEIKTIQTLRFLSRKHLDEFVVNEVKLRMYLATYRYLYWMSILSGSKKILFLITFFKPDNLLKADQSERAQQIELLDVLIKDRQLARTLSYIFDVEAELNEIDNETDEVLRDDLWLNQIITAYQRGNMEKISQIAVLRKVALFKNLPAETLQIMVENIELREMQPGQTIVAQGDVGDGMYIVAHGSVIVKNDSRIVNELHEGSYFGELALIDNLPRTNTVIAKEPVKLFYLDRIDFLRLCDDFPEILRELIRNLVRYIRTT